MSLPRRTSFIGDMRLLFLIFGVCTAAAAALHKQEIDGGGNRNDSTAAEAKGVRRRVRCVHSDIVINQGPSEPLPSGIPTYRVEITNLCLSGCHISGIHLSCRWFSSAVIVNPRIFKRLRFNDCLVNDGKPLLNGRTLSFQYANTFSFPLAVSKINCSRNY